MMTGLVVPGISGAPGAGSDPANVKTGLASSVVVRLSWAEMLIIKSAPISPDPES